MRLIIFLLLFSYLGLQASPSCSQSNIALNYDNISIATLMDTIEQKREYNLDYKVNDVSENKPFGVSTKDKKTENILSKIFKNKDLNFILFEKQVLLKKREGPVIAYLPLHEAVQDSTINVEGTVTDQNDNPLPGVNITVQDEKGSGTQTDFEGEYTINAKIGQTLKFSYVGFKDQVVEVDNNNTINITMKEGESLEEVKVEVGYGSQKKIDNTSAITSVKSKDIMKTKAESNVAKSLQGKVSGLQISSSDKQGTDPDITIRGAGTILGGKDPLFVVDGMYRSDLNNINPNDIESVDVLKDASALAIYGNRASNGAIIITTKSGKGKKGLSIEYNGSIGVRTPLKKVSMANSTESAQYDNIARGEQNALLSENQPYNTDWFDEITRTAIYNEHNIIVSGASEKINYLFSLSNFNEKELQKGAHYNRPTLRTNNEFKISDQISLIQRANISYRKQRMKPNGAFNSAYQQSPIVPTHFEEGRYGAPLVKDGKPDPKGTELNNIGNPLAQNKWHDEIWKRLKLEGGVNLKIDFAPFINGLTFNSQFNVEYYQGKNYSFDNGKRIPGIEPPSFDNHLNNLREDYFNWVFSNNFNYQRTFGIHEVEATLGTEFTDDSGLNTIRYEREDINSNENYWNLAGTNYADNTTLLNSVNLTNSKTISYFGRVQYKLMDRYLINGTVRRDGTSKFIKDNRWGTFPAFGLGWIMSKEKFLDNVNFIDNLKLRGGWGRIGNQEVPINRLTLASGDNLRYSFDGEHVTSGMTIDQQLDPNLTWEVTEESDFGIDFELLGHKLNGAFNLYNKKTTNTILQSTPISTAGIGTSNPSHMGEVTNKGIEIELSWSDNIGNDFNYSVDANYSYNKNKVNKVNPDINIIRGGNEGLNNGQYTKLFGPKTEGQPLGSFYLWETDGYNEDGSLKFKDKNDNGVTGEEDPDDRKFMGSYLPKHTLGLSLNFSYKKWDLSIDGYGAFGHKLYNGKKAMHRAGENIEKSVANDFWTPDNTHAKNPAPHNSIPISSDYYLESGDYFRINDIIIGYTFDNFTDFISSLRLYFNAQNPFIIQSFSGYTPESGKGDVYGDTGIEVNSYPALRSFVFGMNLQF